MTARQADERAAAATGRDRLRTSYADREHVIDVLKVAFVQGRLTKDELDSRAGQTYASRTYGELAALTADLPTGLVTGAPGQVAQAFTSLPAPKVVALVGLVVPPQAMVVATVLTSNRLVAQVTVLVVMFWLMAWVATGAELMANWHDRRSRGRLPQVTA